jgi:outer membrane immunogenic protein
MSKRFISIVLCLGCYFVTLPAVADEWFYGLKLVYFESDLPDADNPDNAGLILGYDWAKDYGTIGIEGDLTSTYEDGTFAGEDLSMDTLGIYATYKTRKSGKRGIGFYLKAKAGVAYYDVSGADPLNKDDTVGAAGLGVGVDMGALSFELEYSTLDDFDMVNFQVRF